MVGHSVYVVTSMQLATWAPEPRRAKRPVRLEAVTPSAPTMVASTTPEAPSVPPERVTATSLGATEELPIVATQSCDGPRNPVWPLLTAETILAQSVAPEPAMLSKISGT